MSQEVTTWGTAPDKLTYRYYDKNGQPLNVKPSNDDDIWCYMVEGEKVSYYISTIANEPRNQIKHHNLNNHKPQFVKVSQEIFVDYSSYLTDSSSLAYTRAQQQYKLKGYTQ